MFVDVQVFLVFEGVRRPIETFKDFIAVWCWIPERSLNGVKLLYSRLSGFFNLSQVGLPEQKKLNPEKIPDFLVKHFILYYVGVMGDDAKFLYFKNNVIKYNRFIFIVL